MNNFIFKKIINDLRSGFPIKSLKFRFSPEPNGVLHLGHVKAIYINFYLAKYFNSKVNLRFDDTNPKTENLYFVNNIIKYIKWLGFSFSEITFTSDYFEILYKLAIKLIKKEKAFVEIRKKKINTIGDNLYYFNKMKLGHYNDNDIILRANTLKDLPTYHIKNPVMYRVIKMPHYKTKDKWCIYPTYDWAHGQSDYIEKISHSLCSIEFQNHRPLYNWFINNIYDKNYNIYKPKQIEFSRLNIINTVTSKRYFNLLVKKKIIKSYSDPRLITLNSLKLKGYTPENIINFIIKNGFTKRNTKINIEDLEIFTKKYLLKNSDIIMGILSPIKIIIKNFKKNAIKWINIDNNYKIPFTKILYIEKNDFKIIHNKNFFRLSFNNYVRLKYCYIIKAYKVKIKNNKPKTIYCKIYKGIKNVKSTIQWVSNKFKKIVYIKDYKYINIKNNKILNTHLKNTKILIDKNYHKKLKIKKNYQLLRIGFFNYYKSNKFLKIFYMKRQY